MATASSTPRKTTSRARKAAPAKAASTPAKAEAPAEEETSKATERYSLELEYVPADERLGKTTKQGNTVKNVRSEKFVPPQGSGVQGQLYFPLGTRRVKITFLGE